MWKSSIKLCLATFLFTLTLASFAFAGEGHCPIAPPPPDEAGRSAIPVVTGTDIFVNDSYQFLNEIWELFAEIAN